MALFFRFQIDDELLEKLRIAIGELPQRPVLLLSGDFYQLGPMQSQRATVRWLIEHFKHMFLTECHRTTDPQLLDFLAIIRSSQPSRQQLHDFFDSRRLSDDLDTAVRQGMAIAADQGRHFIWLTVTNKGAQTINEHGCAAVGITPELLATAPHGDPKVHAGPVYAKPGVMIRLTRNLDKDRGFVNGAIGEVVDVLSDRVFTLRLSCGTMVLVHPIVEEWKDEDGHPFRRTFLPCCYGYATTIRRAQGTSLHLGALYFNHDYPPEPGYGYVAVSRFRAASGIYLYGRIRRTDFLPVLAKREDQRANFQRKKSDLSNSDDDAEMSVLDQRGMDRMDAMHEETSLVSDQKQPDMDFSDVDSIDSKEEELDGPAMKPEGAADAMEDSDADLFEF